MTEPAPAPSPMPESQPSPAPPEPSQGPAKKEAGRIIHDALGLMIPGVLKGLESGSAIYKNVKEADAAIKSGNLYEAVHDRVGPAAERIDSTLEHVTDAAVTVGESAAQASQAICWSADAWRQTAESTEQAVKQASQNIQGVAVMARSGLHGIVGLLEEAVEELRMINYNLQGIRDELRAQNILHSSGGSQAGFAEIVYGQVRGCIRRHPGDDHRFFVWHPDTTWHWQFDSLCEENPFPDTFCAYSDDLDRLITAMKVLRAHVPPGTIFHLIIPAWYPISIKTPLHFPDELLPLRVVGHKHAGAELVAFNLPRAQADLTLVDVANALDPNGYNARATVAAGATLLFGGGWGVNGVCLAAGIGLGTVTGLGALVVIPVWFGSVCTVGASAMETMATAVNEALCEEAPRILGSGSRLESTGGFF